MCVCVLELSTEHSLLHLQRAATPVRPVSIAVGGKGLECGYLTFLSHCDELGLHRLPLMLTLQGATLEIHFC